MPRPAIIRTVKSTTESSVSTNETKTTSKSSKAASISNVHQRTNTINLTTRSKAVAITHESPKLRQSTLTPLISKFKLTTPVSTPEKRLERSDSEAESVKERLRKSPKKSPSTYSQEQNIEPEHAVLVVDQVKPAPRRNLFGKSGDSQDAASPRSSTHRITTPEAPKKLAKPLQKSVKDQQPKITESFPVRKSSRLQRDVKKEKDEEQKMIQQRILDGVEDERIEVQDIPGKGRGLIAMKPFKKNEFVVEYAGPLLSAHEAKELEMNYAKEPEKHKTGCYMYYFEHRGLKKCIDATAESGRYGRLLNHSRTRPNLRTEVFEIVTKKGVVPHLILRAMRDIEEGEELLYDYGDRSPASLEAFPWLKD